MSSDPKPVIPTPPAQRWKEFRIRALPSIVVLLMTSAIAALWVNYITPVSLVGKVETIQADVASPKAGTVSQLRVARFQKVVAGEPIAQVITTDPKVLESSLAVIKAEIELLRMSLSPLDNANRNVINYEQMQMEWMRQRADLATAQVNVRYAEDEFQRQDKLFQDNIITKATRDLYYSKMQALKTDVEEKTKLVESSSLAVNNLRPLIAAMTNSPSQMQAAIDVEEQKLQLTTNQLSPITLKAPIDGLVSMIHRWSGETVAVGDPIITISAMQGDRIVGYLRQPLYLRPQKEMPVLVRTRGGNRLMGMGRILAVGAQLQPLNDAYIPPMKNANAELGLPLLISMPIELKTGPGELLKVHPGELVDLTLLPNKK